MVADHIVKLGGRFYKAGEELPEMGVPSTHNEKSVEPKNESTENNAPIKRGRKKAED